MYKEVHCTITVKTNKFQCVLRIGETGSDWWWTRIGGQLSLGPEFGNWAYIGDGAGNRDGIALASTTEDNPRFHAPGNIRAVLDGVPERFYERVTPASPLAGEGRIIFSNMGGNHAINWEMRFPQ